VSDIIFYHNRTNIRCDKIARYSIFIWQIPTVRAYTKLSKYPCEAGFFAVIHGVSNITLNKIETVVILLNLKKQDFISG